MSEEISQLKERVITLQKNESDLQSSIRDLTAYKSKLTKEVAEFEILHEQVESSLAVAQTQLESVKKELNSAEQLLKHTIEDTENYVEREATDRKKREMDAHVSINNLSDREKELKKRITELESKISDLSTTRTIEAHKLNIVRDDLKIVNGDLVESQKLMSEYTIEIEKLKSARERAEKNLYDILNQIEEKTPLLNEIDSKLDQVSEERVKLEAEKAEFSKVIASVNRQKEILYKESLTLEKKFKQLGIPVKLT